MLCKVALDGAMSFKIALLLEAVRCRSSSGRGETHEAQVLRQTQASRATRHRYPGALKKRTGAMRAARQAARERLTRLVGLQAEASPSTIVDSVPGTKE